MVAGPNGCGKTTLTRTRWLRNIAVIEPTNSTATGTINCTLGEVGNLISIRLLNVEFRPLPQTTRNWLDEIKADLARQVEAGATLYGVRCDGSYIARTNSGDRVIEPPTSSTR